MWFPRPIPASSARTGRGRRRRKNDGPAASRRQPGCRAWTAPRHAGGGTRDRAARVRRHLRPQRLLQHVAVRGAVPRHRSHLVRHLDRADLCAHRGRFRAERRLHARGLRRPLPARHRRQPRPGARAHGRDAWQTARRYPRLRREAARARRQRRAAAGHPRHPAQGHDRACRRDRRRHGVRQRRALAHGATRSRHFPRANDRMPASSSAT